MINSRLRWQIRLQSGLFIVLFLVAMGLLAWLSQLNPLSIDLTANQRNSLSAETIRLVKSLQHPVEITIFISPINENREVLERLFERYQHQQPLVKFRSLNPDLSPEPKRYVGAWWTSGIGWTKNPIRGVCHDHPKFNVDAKH